MTQDKQAGNAPCSWGLTAVSLDGEEHEIGIIQLAVDAEGICNELNEYHHGLRDEDTWYEEHPVRSFHDDLDLDEIAKFTVQKMPYIGDSR